ncbi:hypothetical protein TNIN_76931 [Trichonephila inaurata madagascariensis]|uniref:Uncharacterized protein n=1 Tax=Trichonephila inaurata madagascariensis TaxID=2747483 RepID=A0A8X6WSD0_9ARAC|nr:hypothetical protein TNIN_76931 [Trichonephila inaurata madagascariensis]
MLSRPHTCLSSSELVRGETEDNISPALGVAEAAHLKHVQWGERLSRSILPKGHGGILSNRVVVSGRNCLRMRKPA